LGWSLGLNYVGNDIKKVGFTYGLNTDVFFQNHTAYIAQLNGAQ
jgi:long-subunit fatty acid transport protein